MSESQRPLRVFLFHAPADRAAVRDLYLRLLHDGVDAWLVKEKLLPGQDWKHEIHEAIRAADLVLLFLSEQFNRGEFPHGEARSAFDAVLAQAEDGFPLLSVRLDEAPLPGNLETWPSVDLSATDGYERLMQAVQARAAEAGATLQRQESMLPQFPSSANRARPVPEEKAVEAPSGAVEIVEGAGILIENSAAKRYNPQRVILLALLGFGVILLLLLYGPPWIEQTGPVTLTAEVDSLRTPARSTPGGPATPRVLPLQTLTSQGQVSHLVFLIDTSGSMRGQRISMVKSAVSDFVSGLGDDYLISVLEFDTNVELRSAVTMDHAGASEAIQSIAVEVSHDGSCAEDALSVAVQQASLPPADEAEAIIILLTDVAEGDSLGWSCNFPYSGGFGYEVGNRPIPIFTIYLGDNFLRNQFVVSLPIFWEQARRPAKDKESIEHTLLLISQAAGLELNPESTTPVAGVHTRPLSMIFVPAGEFIMGNNNTVSLDAFWIDKTEVTNTMYLQCAWAEKCRGPHRTSSHTREDYFGNPEFDNYPVIYVSWEDARDYCAWAGGRLPTEAEWEKAARGTDGREYPWGDVDPSGTPGLLNFQAQDTVRVGLYADGASPYGALDMAGNVSEWVADWLSPDYYSNPPASNPMGPDSGEYRVWRGGSWVNTFTDQVRTYSRSGNFPTDSSGGIGFRCARGVDP